MFKNIAELRAANKAINHHWFDRETIRFFNSKIESKLHGGVYFVTSERFDNEAKKFAIRKANPDGSVSTIGKMRDYATLEAALEALGRLL